MHFISRRFKCDARYSFYSEHTYSETLYIFSLSGKICIAHFRIKFNCGSTVKTK